MRGCARILAPALLALLAGCRGEPPVYTASFTAFGATADLSLVGVETDAAEAARRLIEQDLAFLDAEWRSRDASAMQRVNRLLPTGKPFVAPPSILPAVRLSQRLATQSDDLFNPASGQLLAAWGFRGGSSPCGPPPDPARLQRLVAAAPTMADIHVDGLEMASTNPAVQLDLDLVIKGYGIDLAIETLRERGIRNAMIRIGDDLRAIGDRAGKPWRIAIRGPSGSAVFGIVEIGGDESVFTAGDYERTLLYEGKTYHHIIDPRTGYPADGARAVTVVHRDAATADAAARALFIAGPDRWRSIAAEMDVDQVLLFDRSGTVQMTPAMAARLDRIDEEGAVVVSPPLPAGTGGQGPERR